MDMARGMMVYYHDQCRKDLWAEAAHTACYTESRIHTPSNVIDLASYELLNRKKPDLFRLGIFGCKAYAHIPSRYQGG